MKKSDKQIGAIVCGVFVVLLFGTIGVILYARGFFD